MVSKGDSNPGSLDCESGILSLTYCTPICNVCEPSSFGLPHHLAPPITPCAGEPGLLVVWRNYWSFLRHATSKSNFAAQWLNSTCLVYNVNVNTLAGYPLSGKSSVYVISEPRSNIIIVYFIHITVSHTPTFNPFFRMPSTQCAQYF